jgi:hypothetical protein
LNILENKGKYLGLYNYRESSLSFNSSSTIQLKNTYSNMRNLTSQRDNLQLTREDTPKTIKSKLKGCQPELLKSLCFSGIHVTEDILTHCCDLMSLRLLELDHCRFTIQFSKFLCYDSHTVTS